MDDMDRKLRSFGIDPDWVREEIRQGREWAVMEALDRADEELALRRVELEDLREGICEMTERFRERTPDSDVLTDEDLEMLNAAGNPFPQDGRLND